MFTRQHGGDRLPDRPAPSKAPIALWNGASLNKSSRKARLGDLGWDEDEHPNDATEADPDVNYIVVRIGRAAY